MTVPWHHEPPHGRPHRTGQLPAGTAPRQPTAARALRHLALTAAAAAGVTTLTMFIAGDRGRLPAGGVAAVLIVAAVATAGVVGAVRRAGRTLTRELLHGYTTTTFTAGAWWLPHSHPDRPAGWVHWDFTGIDVVAADGTVTDPARPGAAPPGFYPSPHEPGRLELWTGSQWTRHHLDGGHRHR